jgi:hypothetical protein
MLPMTKRLIRGAVLQMAALALCLVCSDRATELAPQQTESPHFVFTDAGSGRTGGHNARYISFHNYQSNDGVVVQRSVESYKSEQAAHVRLKNLMDHASRVIETGVKKEADGSLIGQRIVVLSKVPNGKLLNIVAWTDGPRVYLLQSQSLRHLVDFEEQVYPSPPKTAPR